MFSNKLVELKFSYLKLSETSHNTGKTSYLKCFQTSVGFKCPHTSVSSKCSQTSISRVKTLLLKMLSNEHY